VTGTYLSQASNVRMTALITNGCALFPPPTGDPPPTPVGVRQEGGTLYFETTIGQAQGVINERNGVFDVVVNVPPSTPCPFGCSNTTSGQFILGQNPMVYVGVAPAGGRIDIKGPTGAVICRVTYDVYGTRTSCPIAAQRAGNAMGPPALAASCLPFTAPARWPAWFMFGLTAPP
jgi:hypothetical protein